VTASGRRKQRLPAIATALALGAAAVVTLRCGAPGGTVEIPLLDDPAKVDPLVVSRIDEAVGMVRESPRDGGAWGRLGRLYHANEFYELASRCYENAERLDTTTVDWPYYLGVLASDRGKTEDAVSRFRVVVRLQPGYAPAWVRLGDALLARGETDAAIDAYRRHDEIAPDQPWGRVGQGRASQRAGRLEEAARHLEEAHAMEPRDPETCYLLAAVYRSLGRSGESERLLQRFSELGHAVTPPDPLLARMEREASGVYGMMREANALMKANRLERAEELYWKILAERPDEYTALVNLAELCLRRKRPAEARALWDRAVEVEPEVVHGRFGLARSLLAISKFDAAEVELREVLRLDPDHAEARDYLTRLQRRPGRPGPPPPESR
jgi:tetratricopeptide (TPR) repeat protein